jgi:hypothetical protein
MLKICIVYTTSRCVTECTEFSSSGLHGYLAFITSFRPVAFSAGFGIVVASGLMALRVLESINFTCQIQGTLMPERTGMRSNFVKVCEVIRQGVIRQG